MPGASGAWGVDGAWQGGRDLWEGWDESSLLGGRNLQCEQRWFKVNVVDSRFSSTSHIPRRCVVTQHNMGCGYPNSKNTLTKVFVFHMKVCYTHAYMPKTMRSLKGTLWRPWSQEMPWALGSVQLLSKPDSWRVWGQERILVYAWQGPEGIPRKRILRPLC